MKTKRRWKKRVEKNECRYTDEEFIQMNKFRKDKYKIGQLIKTKEELKNKIYRIEQIIDKGQYNMYIAKNIKFGWTLTITDRDEYEIIG